MKLPLERQGLVVDRVLEGEHDRYVVDLRTRGIIDLRTQFLRSIFRSSPALRWVAVWRLLQLSFKYLDGVTKTVQVLLIKCCHGLHTARWSIVFRHRAKSTT